MSMRRVLLAFVLAFLAPAISRACPGSLALGLPLLFGKDQPESPWPSVGCGTAPLVDLTLPAGFEEAAEFQGPPARPQLAVECLKAWRQLVREGRFEQAAPVAAKAAALDPTNLDAQHAVIVSQMLKTIGEKDCAKTTAACPMKSFSFVIGAAQGCESCPKAGCPAEQSACQKFQIELSLGAARFVPGSAAAILSSMCPAKAVSATKPGEDCAAVKPACCEDSSEDRAIAMKALRYLFPDGLAGTPTTPNRLPIIRECSGVPAVTATTFEIVVNAPKSPRVSVKAAGWTVECDRIVSMNEREMILDGNVSMTMSGRNVAVAASRVRVDLVSGTISTEAASAVRTVSGMDTLFTQPGR